MKFLLLKTSICCAVVSIVGLLPTLGGWARATIDGSQAETDAGKNDPWKAMYDLLTPEDEALAREKLAAWGRDLNGYFGSPELLAESDTTLRKLQGGGGMGPPPDDMDPPPGGMGPPPPGGMGPPPDGMGPPPPPRCGSEFARTTIDEIKAVIGYFVASFVPENFQQTTLDELTKSLKYNITAHMVCGRCSNITDKDLSDDALNNASPYGFLSYCSSDSYGYEARHSALLLTPIDPETKKIVSGTLRGFVAGRSTEIDNVEGPTSRYPRHVLNILENAGSETITLAFRNFLASMVAASTGAIAVMPNMLGYLTSREVDRAFLVPMPYKQAFAVSYVAAQKYVKRETMQCTTLDNVASVAGYSEGGYGATIGALTLQQNGVRILTLKVGAAPFDLDIQSGFTFDRIAQGPQALTLSYFFITPYLGYTFSAEIPILANTGTGQRFLADEWLIPNNFTRNVVSWFDAPDSLGAGEVLALVPDDLAELASADISAVYAAGRVDDVLAACGDQQYVQAAAGGVSSLCQAIVDSSLVDALLNDIDFPTSICHSPNDDLIAYANIPSDLSANSNLELYQPMIPLLGPMGNHQVDHVLCPLDSVIFIANEEGDDTSTKIIPLDEPLPAECLADTTTPTTAPVLVMTPAPDTTPATEPTDAPADSPSMSPDSSSSPSTHHSHCGSNFLTQTIFMVAAIVPALLFSM